MYKFNDQQTAWRINMLNYIRDSETFKQDLLQGKITQEVLETWGVFISTDSDSINFSLNEIK